MEKELAQEEFWITKLLEETKRHHTPLYKYPNTYLNKRKGGECFQYCVALPIL